MGERASAAGGGFDRHDRFKKQRVGFGKSGQNSLLPISTGDDANTFH